MLNGLYEKLGGLSSVPVIIISIAIILIFGFLATRLTKLLKLPNVTAYLLTGILIGPFVMDLIPAPVVSGMDFISDIAVAFIAFSVGEYFRLDVLKSNGKKLTIIALFDILIVTVLVFVLTYFILGLSLPVSIVLSALASVVSPSSTMMTIRQTNARGDYVNTLLSVIAIDDIVGMISFSVAVSIAMAFTGGGISLGAIGMPLLYNVIMVAVGVLLGLVLKLFLKKRSNDNRLIIAVSLLLVICGIGAALDVSPLLGCMAMGMVYINVSGDDKLFKQLNYFSPPILLLFFVHSGLNFRIDTLFSAGSFINGVPLLVVAVLYFVIRTGGKYLGAFTGCAVAKKEKGVRNNLGLALLPQAGVAIGLASICGRVIGGADGEILQTIILTASIIYEIVGPACAKLGLYLSKSYGEDAPEQIQPTQKLSQEERVEQLKEQLYKIENELRDADGTYSEEERAFNEVAEQEFGFSDYIRKNRKFINRR